MKNLVINRDIKFVWHFTRLENLNSIFEEGLKSRQELENNKSNSVFNDQYRLDGHEDAICCSIGHPNYKMFYSLRLQDTDKEWVVIGIKKDILWEKDCAFCIENAASGNVTEIPIEQRKGKDSFNKIFEEIEGKPTRQELGIKDLCPTNPQAEVLIFDRIEPKYIVGAVFQNQKRVDEYSKLFSNFKCIYHRAHFMPRSDYKHWQ